MPEANSSSAFCAQCSGRLGDDAVSAFSNGKRLYFHPACVPRNRGAAESTPLTNWRTDPKPRE